MIVAPDRKRLLPLAIIGLVLAFNLPELGLAKLLFADSPVGARIGIFMHGLLRANGFW